MSDHIKKNELERKQLILLGAFYLLTVIAAHYHKIVAAILAAIGLFIFRRLLAKLLSIGLVQSWINLNAEAESSKKTQFDFRPLVFYCTSAVSLTLNEYGAKRSIFFEFVEKYYPAFGSHPYYELASHVYWIGVHLIGYLVIPWLVTRFMPGERLRDYGLSTKNLRKHLWIYGALFFVVFCPLVLMSFTPSFQRTYPFYKFSSRSWIDFLTWEAMYCLQFFALELFFRGFLLHPLKKALGAYSIFAMAVPYCMIHYNKPLPEVLGAVASGIVLGTLSLNTGSIWYGVFIHMSIALSMDSLSLFQKAGFPQSFFPRL